MSCQKPTNQRAPEVKTNVNTDNAFCAGNQFTMAEAQTPQKVCKGKKPSAESPNSYCRCCKAALRILYGSSWKSVSTENLFRPSGKKGIEGEILSHELNKIGIIVEKSPSLSERLCKPCAAKIRRTCEGFSFIRDTINVPNPKLQFVKEIEVEVEVASDDESQAFRTKRGLPTTVSTPHRSPLVKKPPRISRENYDGNTKKLRGSQLRKSLGEEFQEIEPWPSSDDLAKQNEDAYLNIDDILGSGQTWVKVLILWPNGGTDVKTPSLNEDILLIKNVALNNLQVVANIVFKHPQLRPEILKSLWRSLNTEFKEYSSADSMLKGRSTEDLIAFSSVSFVRELIERCPFWSSCVSGASGVDLKEIDEIQDFAVNSMALPSSVTARVRNNTMSALAYRVSCVILECLIKI